MSNINNLKISSNELSMVLAALRLYQASPDDVRAGVSDIATDNGSCFALTDPEIDDLCERLNTNTSADESTFNEAIKKFGTSVEKSVYLREAHAQKNDLPSGLGLTIPDCSVVLPYCGGAMVMAWLDISDDSARVSEVSACMERMLECVSPKPGTILDVYSQWLEELLTNYSSELDDLANTAPITQEREKLAWSDPNHDDLVKFYPSDALTSLLAESSKHEFMDASDADRVKAFIDSYGEKLDCILSNAITH